MFFFLKTSVPFMLSPIWNHQSQSFIKTIIAMFNSTGGIQLKIMWVIKDSKLLLGHKFFIPNILTKLGCQLLGLSLLQLSDTGCWFGAQDAASPVTTDLKEKFRVWKELSLWYKYLQKCVQPQLTNTHLFISVIVVGLDGFHKLSKCAFVLTSTEKK